MLLKKIIGSLIIILNIAGLGFLLYMAGLMLKEKFFPKKQIIAVQQTRTKSQAKIKKKQPEIANDNILSEEDDLLKDMDLSDLDSLNLDDFE